MDDLDALLAELEQTSASLSVSDPEPQKVCFLLERDKKEPAAIAAETSTTQNKKLVAPGTPKVQPGYSVQRHEEDAENIYRWYRYIEAMHQPQTGVMGKDFSPSRDTLSKVPTPQPVVSSASSSTSAAQQLDDLLSFLGTMQSKVSEDLKGSGEPSTMQPKTTDTLDSMLKGLTQDMKELGVATVPKGDCAFCRKPIVGKVVTAMGKTWHSEHFTCAQCGREVGSQPFYERDSMAYCQEDYHQLFSPRCAYCTSPIKEKILTAMNQTWHPEHFFCAHCGKVFENDAFHEKNGKPYCQKDFLALFSPKCRGCDRPVMDQYLSALNAIWHSECFVCGDCFCTFGNGSFFELDGRPYCELHYHHRQGTVCHGCGKPIAGRCVSAMGHRFHPEHFVCAFCLTQLHNGIFQEQNGKTYCHSCFSRLFVV